MKRIFVLMVMSVCCLSLLSCKSDRSELAMGVDASGVTYNSLDEFFPKDCLPVDAYIIDATYEERIKRKIVVIELDENCTNPRDLRKIEINPQTPTIK